MHRRPEALRAGYFAIATVDNIRQGRAVVAAAVSADGGGVKAESSEGLPADDVAHLLFRVCLSQSRSCLPASTTRGAPRWALGSRPTSAGPGCECSPVAQSLAHE